MKTFLPWLLWLWIAGVIAAAFNAPLAQDFLGESSRILYFHVPMALVSCVAFLAAGVWSCRYLFGKRNPRHDHAAHSAVELGLVFCILATVTGAIWGRVEWGAYWNWDPRQTSIVMALLFYGAYLALRSAVPDVQTRRRLSAAYAVLGLAVAPFLYFVAPRMAAFTLHPQPLLNAEGELRMSGDILSVLLASFAAFTVLFFWVHNLRSRTHRLAEVIPSYSPGASNAG